MDRQTYLLHQVHPAKLAADLSASVISTWLFWPGRYLGAGVSGLALPVVASALVVRGDCSWLKGTAVGRYVLLKFLSECDKASMQALLTLLTQWSVKAWVAVIVAVFSCGTAAVFYLSSANAGSNSTPGNPTVAVQTGQVAPFGGAAAGCRPGSVPVVPEANAGLVLIPVMAAMLLVASRRLWPLRPAATASAQEPPGEPKA